MNKIDKLHDKFNSLDPGLSKCDRLEQAILELVQSGQFKSGAAIPPHRKIAEEFDMALGLVTKAINSLKKRGFYMESVGAARL